MVMSVEEAEIDRFPATPHFGRDGGNLPLPLTVPDGFRAGVKVV